MEDNITTDHYAEETLADTLLQVTRHAANAALGLQAANNALSASNRACADSNLQRFAMLKAGAFHELQLASEAAAKYQRQESKTIDDLTRQKLVEMGRADLVDKV